MPGKQGLLRRGEIARPTGAPEADKRLTHWECAQHLARVIEAPDGGIEAAARLYSEMGESGRGGAHAGLPPLRHLRPEGPGR